MYKITACDHNAKSAEMTTVHGTIQTPVFMNVATDAAIKGGVTSEDLERIGTQVMLCNTYHLKLMPGDRYVYRMGGLNTFTSWNKPILTDSGGFQVFSLSKTRKITEEGVTFRSHLDGRALFMGPRESMRIQSHLGSTIAMAFDECPSAKAERAYVEASVARTTRWLKLCVSEMNKLNSLEGTLNKDQILFGINQGAVFDDIRVEHARQIADMDLYGYAIGGLAVGESHEEMYRVIEKVAPVLPKDKPLYLMGVGTPENILEAVDRGVDFFDCVYPTRNGRHGQLYTEYGKINIKNKRYEFDERPIEEGCGCDACRRHSRSYIRHLLKAGEILGLRLCVNHNLYHYNRLMEDIRSAIRSGSYGRFKKSRLERMKYGED